MKVIFKESAI